MSTFIPINKVDSGKPFTDIRKTAYINREDKVLIEFQAFLLKSIYLKSLSSENEFGNEEKTKIKELAAQAYSKYQKCRIYSARKLFDK